MISLISQLGFELPYFVFLISFYDPGPHGNFRYSQNMLPEVTETDFRKGSQVILQSSLLNYF
jgi:hypothetical protein